MATRGHNRYVQTYSFGTDGNAALVGEPIASQRKVTRPPINYRERPPQKKGLPVSHLAIVLFLVALAVIAITLHGNLANAQKQVQFDIAQQQLHLRALNDDIARVEQRLVEAADESRIRSIAMNRLGMQAPVDSQIVHVPKPYVATEESNTVWQPQTANRPNFMQILLSMFGL